MYLGDELPEGGGALMSAGEVHAWHAACRLCLPGGRQSTRRPRWIRIQVAGIADLPWQSMEWATRPVTPLPHPFPSSPPLRAYMHHRAPRTKSVARRLAMHDEALFTLATKHWACALHWRHQTARLPRIRGVQQHENRHSSPGIRPAALLCRRGKCRGPARAIHWWCIVVGRR
jgi:hypothetical protein